MVLVLVAAIVGVALGWRLSGGSWAVIESPSMGRAAPLGTLILTDDRPMSDVREGDVITFHPPATPEQVYTHRVVQTYPDGTVQVQGDINGAPDPMPIGEADLMGVVVARLHGVGWLVKGLPPVVLSVVVLLVATRRYLSTRWRSSARVVGLCLTLAAVALLLRPFVHPVLMFVDPLPRPDGTHLASVVSGGIFPTRVTGASEAHVDLRAGEVGLVPVLAEQAGGPMMVNGSPNLEGWWLFAAILVSLLPLLWCMVVGLAPDEEKR